MGCWRRWGVWDACKGSRKCPGCPWGAQQMLGGDSGRLWGTSECIWGIQGAYGVSEIHMGCHGGACGVLGEVPRVHIGCLAGAWCGHGVPCGYCGGTFGVRIGCIWGMGSAQRV